MTEAAIHSPTAGSAAPWQQRLALTLRGFVILVLVTTAIGKLLDVPGFARVLGHYEIFPGGLQLPLAFFIPLFELLLAFWLLSGKKLPAAALTALLLHGAYAALSMLTLLRGIRLDNCGCFGVFLARPLGWGTVIEDGVMIAICLLLYRWAIYSGAGRSRA